MIRLHPSLNAWGSPAFSATLKQEIEQLSADQLMLQRGLSFGSHALSKPVAATILGVVESTNSLQVRAGIFFKSVIGGCSCADDPTPMDEIDEYCEVMLEIDKADATTTIALVT